MAILTRSSFTFLKVDRFLDGKDDTLVELALLQLSLALVGVPLDRLVLSLQIGVSGVAISLSFHMVASFKRRCLFIRRKLACALFVDNDHVFSVCVISCGLLRYSRCESVNVERVYLLLRVATVFEGLDAAVVQCWAKLLSHVAILMLALVSPTTVDGAEVLRL